VSIQTADKPAGFSKHLLMTYSLHDLSITHRREPGNAPVDDGFHQPHLVGGQPPFQGMTIGNHYG